MHVHAVTHQGIDEDTGLPFLRPPWAAITDLVRRYLGPQPRAGQTFLPRTTGGGEQAVYRAAGFTGPQRLSVLGATVTRTVEEVVAAVHSLSRAAPHLFGDRLGVFDDDLRTLLRTTSDDGRFSEQMRAIEMDLWR